MSLGVKLTHTETRVFSCFKSCNCTVLIRGMFQYRSLNFYPSTLSDLRLFDFVDCPEDSHKNKVIFLT